MQPGTAGGLGGVAVHVLPLQVQQLVLHLFGVQPAAHKALEGPAAEHPQPLGVVLGGDAVGVVVAAEHIAAEAAVLQSLTQQAGDLAFAHAAAAAHADDRAAVGVGSPDGLQFFQQHRQDAGRLGPVGVVDLHLVARHVAVHNGIRVHTLLLMSVPAPPHGRAGMRHERAAEHTAAL